MIKRSFDLLFSLSALIVLLPFFAIIAFALKLASSGPIFYSQLRLGKAGILFRCYKFRTMHVDADQLLEAILNEDPKRKEEWELYQKLEHDPRTFFLGLLLRLSSLDELPQFYNVLKGDISIVGPRPYLPSQLDIHSLDGQKILSKKPGLTGLWQTSGRNSTTFQKRIDLDLHYVKKESFWVDLLIVLKTFKTIFMIKHAR